MSGFNTGHSLKLRGTITGHMNCFESSSMITRIMSEAEVFSAVFPLLEISHFLTFLTPWVWG